ncbi:RidA family protein [Streptomyces sp. AJS327]|uniref:Rid family detoxifying hydrolase n=1 Tax=Streptomyces sp. AJS327 TaxID=2545265 RepID=UPI0015DE51CD|nr:Rid family detoxifying hydrolase [Streptomyces sp. AJS327]MBA0051227.1 RidA family protein [Streptomyces sp. AJS327]
MQFLKRPSRMTNRRGRTLGALTAAAVLAAGLGGASAVAHQGGDDEGGKPHSGKHRPITTPDAPEAIGPYSQGISAGNMTFVSGQLPIDPKTGEIPADSSIEEQTRLALRNVRAILRADGLSLKHVVSTTVYVADLDDFDRFNTAYAKFFGSSAPPSRSTVEAARVPKDAKVEVAAIAVR